MLAYKFELWKQVFLNFMLVYDKGFTYFFWFMQMIPFLVWSMVIAGSSTSRLVANVLIFWMKNDLFSWHLKSRSCVIRISEVGVDWKWLICLTNPAVEFLSCPLGQFLCSLARTCIPLSKRCDGVVDCLSENSDEMGCRKFLAFIHSL